MQSFTKLLPANSLLQASVPLSIPKPRNLFFALTQINRNLRLCLHRPGDSSTSEPPQVRRPDAANSARLAQAGATRPSFLRFSSLAEWPHSRSAGNRLVLEPVENSTIRPGVYVTRTSPATSPVDGTVAGKPEPGAAHELAQSQSDAAAIFQRVLFSVVHSKRVSAPLTFLESCQRLGDSPMRRRWAEPAVGVVVQQ